MTSIEDKINECLSKCDIFGDDLNLEQFFTVQKLSKRNIQNTFNNS